MIAHPKIIINGRYRLLGELGRGGMGVVHRAYDRLFDRVVALKQVNFRAAAPLQQEEELRVLLAREFHLLASLWHPNVIRVLDYGFDAERHPFYTMEWVEYHRTLIQAAHEVALPARLDLFRQMCEALEYLHRRGIIHYDLKPSNVLVDLNDSVLLMDFGLAAKLARYNVFAGTPSYMAPEVLRGQPGTPATDLYTVGVMLHEVFTGTIPFIGGDGRLEIDLVLHQPIDLPRLVSLTGSAPLALVIARLLAKHPEDRYPNARAALTALYRAFNEIPPREAPIILESHLRPPFVGREIPLGQLTSALDEAIAGRGSAWLIGGESGVGKSRLADELKAIALTRGVQVLNGQGIEDSGAPYQFWRMPLRQLVLQAPPHSFDASPFTLVVPDVEMLTGEPTRPLHPDDFRRQEALTEAIRAVFAVQTQPSLLVLEDLQWARESLVPLAALIDSVAALPVMVVGIYRSDEFGSLPKQLPGTQVITLDRFGRDEIARLIAAILGSAERAAPLVDQLMNQTEGNAFYLVEFMRLLAEVSGGLDAITDDMPESGWMTEGIRALLLRRLNRIPEDDFLYLRYAAIIGREIDFDTLRSIDPTFDFSRWLASNVNIGILEVMTGGRVRFTHDKMREALLATIPESRRAELYWLVASAYEIRHAADAEYALRLFSLWKEAGDPDKMRQYGETALRVVLAANDTNTAAPLIDSLIALTPPDQADALAGLLVHKVEVARLRGESREELDAQIDTALRLSDRITDRAILLDLYTLLISFITNYGGYDKGLMLTEQALALVPQVASPEREFVLLGQVTILYIRIGRIADAAQIMQRAELMLRPEHPRSWHYQIVRNRPQLYRSLGEPERALQAGIDLLHQYGDLMTDFQLDAILQNIAVASWELGQLDQADQYISEALIRFESAGDRWGQCNMVNLQGYVALDRGDYAAALTHFQHALPLSIEASVPSLTLDVLLGIARLWLAIGDVTGAGNLIGLALHHPDSNEDVRLTAEPILEQFTAACDPAECDAILLRGARLDLKAVVRAIINGEPLT